MPKARQTPKPPSPPSDRSDARAAPHVSARALAGGRVTTDSTTTVGFGLMVQVPPPTYLESWRTLKLDAKTLDRISATKLAEYLLDLSPDISKGQWDFSRLSNPGWECDALRPGTQDVDPKAQLALASFIKALGLLYGSPDVVFNRLFMGAFMRGALLAELVLDQAGRMPIDLATPDPSIARFRQIVDRERGTVYQPGQVVGVTGRSGWVPWDRPTVVYIPLDPTPGNPYGRPMIAPALFAALFVLSVLHDLKRVIQQQGYPRNDIEIDLSKLALPVDIEVGTVAYFAWLQSIVDQVSSAYSSVEPDDSWVHTSVAKLNKPVAAASADALGGIGQVMEFLERQLVRALKTAPFMMGVNQSTTETQANRQWEAQLQGVKSVQHLAEALLQALLGLALQAQGIVAEVRFRFAENRASERMRDAQAEQLEIGNSIAAYGAGYTSHDEAAKAGVGVDKADVPEPRVWPTGVSPVGGLPTPDPASVNPEPGADRFVDITRAAIKARDDVERVAVRALGAIVDGRLVLVPAGGKASLDALPEDVTVDDAALDDASSLWDDTMPARYKGVLEADVVNGSA